MTTKRAPQPTLTGSRVVLRPWNLSDAPTIFAACQDAEIHRWTTIPSPYTETDAIEYVTQFAPAAWEQGGAVFAVIEAATGRPVGSIGAAETKSGVSQLGYWTASQARGRGLTSDALRTITDWFLRDGGAARVELLVEPANTSSARVAEAAGFIREGVLRQYLVLRGRRSDVAIYSMLASDPAATSSESKLGA